MKLNEKLMKIRKAQGLSQEEFGDVIHVSRQAVSLWETGEAVPDTEKLKKIVEKFDVSYEFLLNDEIEDEKDVDSVFEKKYQKRHRKTVQKIVVVIVLIYLLICVYKFIAFTRFYLIAKSFSEEKYSQYFSLRTDGQGSDVNVSTNTTRTGNQKLVTSYSFLEGNMMTDEAGNPIVNEIEFTDFEKKICYTLLYDENQNGYIYNDRKDDMISEEEVEGLFHDENIVREQTLSVIPSGFKEIFLASIDPRYYYVSIKNRQYKGVSFAEDLKIKVQLNEDYLVESIDQKFEYGGIIRWNYSYDYVPGHFGDEIKDPMEKGIYTILEEE